MRDEDPDVQALEHRIAPEDAAACAFSDDVLDDGSASDTGVWSGPPTPKKYDPTQITIQLSMIVVITSCAPTVAFRKPAMPARPRRRASRRDDRDEDQEPAGQVDEPASSSRRAPRRSSPRGTALAADVEEPAAKRERDRQSREHERRPEDQRLLEVRGSDDDVVGVPGNHTRVS